MDDDYIIPIGIDGKGIREGLDEALNSIDKIETKAGKAGKTIEDAFGRGAKAVDDMDDKMKPLDGSFDELGEASRRLRKDLGGALDISKEAGDFAKEIDKVQKRLKAVTEKKKIGLEVDPKAVKDLKDAAKYVKDNYAEMQKTFSDASSKLKGNIEATQKEISVLTSDIKDIEEAMKGMAPGQEHAEMLAELRAAQAALNEETVALQDYESQLKEVSTANKDMAKTLADANKAIVDFEGSGKTLRRQLLEIRREMQQMEFAGEANTPMFEELGKKAASLQTQLDLTSKRIRVMSDESGMLKAVMQGAQGLVGLFSTFNGALALFGTESEEAQQLLLKVNGAMALLQGTQAVMNTLHKDSAFNLLILNRLRKQEAVEIAGVTTATQANTIATRAGTIATRALGVALKALGIGLIISLVALLVSHWDDLVDGFKKILPAGTNVTKMLDQIKATVVGVGNAVFQFLITPFKGLYALFTEGIDGAKDAMKDWFNFRKSYAEGYNRQERKNEENHLKNLEKDQIEADRRDLERRKNRGEDVAKEEIALQKRLLAIQKQGSKEYDEELRRLEDMEDRYYKNQKDARESAQKESQRISEEATKKRLEEEKRANEQLTKFTAALEDARIKQIEDASEREIAAVREEYARRIEVIKQEEALTAEARKLQAELQEALTLERNKRIEKIEQDAEKARLELRIKAQETIAQLQVESLNNDLELLRLDHEKRKREIEEQYKDEAELRIQLIEALEASTAHETRRIKAEWALREVKDEEEKQLLMIELASQYAVRNERTETQKQIALLEIKKEYAQKTLEALIEAGEAEDSLVVLRAKNTIKRLEEELKAEIESSNEKGFDFLTFIGLGDIDDKQRNSVINAGKQLGQSLKEITDFVVSQYDRQIAKKQEVIDQIENDISETERRLDKEKALAEAGYANNVALLEKELEDKKRLREEEIKQQEEIERQRSQMLKAQMVADTAAQMVNMVTASTNIFKSLSGIPFIGIPLAIATIGTMFGAFAAAKIKAAQAIQQGQQYGEGGWIDGKSHSQGGKKYYSDTGDVRELEKDEFVVKKKVAKKYPGFLEALNNETLNANDRALREMLHSLGISFADESLKEGLNEAKQLGFMKHNVSVTLGTGKEVREINKNIRYLARQERERITSWEDEKYIYQKQGDRVIRIEKLPKKPSDEEQL